MSSTSDISKYLDDDTNVVHNSVKDIQLSKDYIEEFGIGELDWKILEGSLHMNSCMTPYQCKHFVADTQLTPWRKCRQAILELETRYHAYIEVKHSLRKAQIQLKMIMRDMENETDDLQKELQACEASKVEYDVTIWKRKYRQSQVEMDSFLKIVKEYVKQEEDLPHFIEMNDKEEAQYWIARMGKQAALDIISYGRISSGNMDSIALMPETDQVEALKIAVRYSTMIQGGLDKLNVQLQPELNKFMTGEEMVAKLQPELQEKLKIEGNDLQ